MIIHSILNTVFNVFCIMSISTSDSWWEYVCSFAPVKYWMQAFTYNQIFLHWGIITFTQVKDLTTSSTTEMCKLPINLCISHTRVLIFSAVFSFPVFSNSSFCCSSSPFLPPVVLFNCTVYHTAKTDQLFNARHYNYHALFVSTCVRTQDVHSVCLCASFSMVINRPVLHLKKL